MENAAGTAALGNIKWSQRWLGSQGWATGMAASRDGLWAKVWFDVSPPFARRLSINEIFMPLLVPGKVPNEMIGYASNGDVIPGSTAGGWGGGFGGPDAQVSYLAYGDGVYASSNFLTDRTYTKTALTGKSVDSNEQTLTRTWAGKSATDPINRDFYIVGMSSNGLFRTLDRGATFPEVSWCPRPAFMYSDWDPSSRWHIVCVDEAGPVMGSGASQRKSRGFVCPNGRGGFITTDGFDSGTRITNLILSGSSAPDTTIGLNGDFYVNKTNHTLQGPKASGTWPSATSLAGGSVVNYGIAAPTDAVGQNGEYYLNTDTFQKYGPKDNSKPTNQKWGQPVRLITTSSNPAFFTCVSSANWIAGKLYVSVVDFDASGYNQTVSAATGGAGNTNAGNFDNVRVYDPANSTWSILAHGMDAKPTLGWTQAIVRDPTNATSFFLWTTASEVARYNGSSWTYTGFGQGAVQQANGLIVHSFLRTVPTDRPNVASRYRNGANCFALSDPIIVPHPTTGLADALMVAPTGLGPLATRLADWPTQNYGVGDPPLSTTKAPLWREITAGAEAKVGQVPLWLGDRLWNGGQDISISLAEDGSRGQGAAVYTFPPTGALSDADDVARGHIPNFGVVYRQRNGANHLMGISYTTDNVTWQIAPNQPPSYDGITNPYSPATIACGANYSCVAMPGWCFGSQTPGLVPVVWADVRSSSPVPITFKKEDGTNVPGLFSQPDSYSGFHGAYFSNPSKKVAIDPANPSRYYFWNIGGCVSGGDWVSDPADVGGIYMMDVNGANPTTATRVYSAKAATGYGNPQRASNFGVFDTAMLIAGDYMFLANNYLFAGPAQTGNRGVVLNIRTWERRFLTTGPGNAMTYALGDQLYGTMPCLWTLAWAADGSAFGAWYSHDWYTANPTWQGPFDATMPTGGWPARMDAHLAVGNEPRRFGLLGVAIRTRGLAYGRLQLG